MTHIKKYLVWWIKDLLFGSCPKCKAIGTFKLWEGGWGNDRVYCKLCGYSENMDWGW